MAWAEGAGVDGRCINFVDSYHSELFKADEEGNRICNPRSFVMFADMIAGIDNWDDPKNIELIKNIAKGCFKDENGRFVQMFSSYIRNKMHLLLQPKEMLHDKWETLKPRIEETLYDSDGEFRPDIASLLERRFSNYVIAWLNSDDKTPIKKVEDRIMDFLNNDKSLFTPDIVYHMLKTITEQKKSQTGRLMFNPKIAKILS